MPVASQTIANEQSAYFVTAAFTDETGAGVVPNVGTLTWTLTDLSGNVVNNRSAVPLTSAASVTIVLRGDDTVLGGALQGTARVVTFQCTYNSSLGSDLELKEQIMFEICDLLAIG